MPARPPGRYAIHCPVGTLTAANYTFVTFDGTLIVNKPPLTVVIDNATRVYGDPDPAFTGTITGLRGTDVITATYSSPATAGSPVGTYPIVPNFIDPAGVLNNYNLILTTGTLTITPAPLSVTADNASRVYGDPNPVFTGAIVGIKNGDNITATYTSVANAASPVGTYPIVANLIDFTHKLSNYTVTKTDGVLTITQAPLTVTAADATRLYGDPNPVFTGTLVGIKNADAITATYSSPATVSQRCGNISNHSGAGGSDIETGQLCGHFDQWRSHDQSFASDLHCGKCQPCLRQCQSGFHRNVCWIEER